ncbi:MAG: hypothetical protein KF912_02390 [Phycisphaeraceae bacterium]|nr:hypothetical protein [Phycisphaeraceae bacterium]MBX3366149.1 hypothetical protein [Phycisphaeraceae bacterium]
MLSLWIPTSCTTHAPTSGDSAGDRIVASRPSGTTSDQPDRTLSVGVVGNQSGIEIQWWVVDDPESLIGAALAKYAERRGVETGQPALSQMDTPTAGTDLASPVAPLDLSEQTRSLWWANGLRILRVPIDDLGAVKSRLDAGTVGHTQWLGLLPTWTQVVSGPDFNGRRAIQLDSGEGGRLVLDGGRMRLLARCWTAPSGDGTPTIRVELVPQHVEPNATKRRELAALESRPWSIEDDGLVFTRLRAGWSADGRVAYLIVPESPATDWTKVSERAERSAAAREREQNIAEATRVGPFAGTIPSVGEAMLTSALSDPDGKIGKRIVIVIVPRLPEKYDLIAE